MKNLLRIFLLLVVAAKSSLAQPLPRSSPEAQGVSSAAMSDFVKAIGKVESMHGLVVVRHGQVIAEGWWTPYAAEHQHVLYSLSKSFTSTAVGLAISEGKLNLFDRVTKFFPDEVPAGTNFSANLKAMRVRDLLTMSTGHQDEPPTAPDEVSPKSFLAQPVPHLPGTHFKYNTAATFMLSAIVQKVTGQTVLDYLRPRIFEPLGIEQPVWATNFQGISLGGYGLRVHTEDIAKFGQMYLQHGNWQGKQLVPADWVAMATMRQTSNGSDPDSDWNQGYGFQFWRCRHNAYRGDGAFGQFCLVMPDQDTVVAINSGVKDLQVLINVVWDKLLPALQEGALPANPDATRQLKDELAQLEVSPATGAETSAQSGEMLNHKFVFPANDQKLESAMLAYGIDRKTLTLTLRIDGKDIVLPCGYHDWKKTRAPVFWGRVAQFPDEPTAGTFGFPADNTCVIKLCAYETPFQLTFTLKFNGNELALDAEANVSFGSTKWAHLAAKAE